MIIPSVIEEMIASEKVMPYREYINKKVAQKLYYILDNKDRINGEDRIRDHILHTEMFIRRGFFIKQFISESRRVHYSGKIRKPNFVKNVVNVLVALHLGMRYEGA